ncbi:MAG: glycosyltransferase [Nanoarchaeota archaeon]|nr:glycosyltransferase [Nanoarchaeota archaeon]
MLRILPKISIVMPVYNGEETIKLSLESIRNQDYPQDKIEIVLIDDDSTDNTLKIAKDYNVKVYKNGKRSYDIGKSIGIEKAKNEFILFMDDDNILPHKNWIKTIVKPFLENDDIAGAEPIWFSYNKKDEIANRYCSLFGINDPLPFYLKKRDRLMQTEKKFNLIKNVKEKQDYFIAKYNTNNLLTLGSIGFLTKKSLLQKTDYKPYFFHMDSIYDLVKQKHNKFAMMKLSITHLHSGTVKDFIKKLKRNAELFFKYNQKRRYKYKTHKLNLIVSLILMITFIKPFYDALRGYLKIKDKAWFLHPFFCFIIPIMYALIFIKWKLKNV